MTIRPVAHNNLGQKDLETVFNQLAFLCRISLHGCFSNGFWVCSYLRKTCIRQFHNPKLAPELSLFDHVRCNPFGNNYSKTKYTPDLCASAAFIDSSAVYRTFFFMLYDVSQVYPRCGRQSYILHIPACGSTDFTHHGN